MKKLALSLCVAAAALFTLPATASAQDKPAGDPPARPARPARLSPEERMKQMTETLGLTQEQQDKIKAIYEKNAPAMKALMDKGFQNLTEEDRTKMRELMKTQTDEVNAVLTDEQKAKMKAEMEKRRGQGRPGGQRNPGGAPPPAAPEK